MAEPRQPDADAARRAVEVVNTVFYEAIESGDLDTMTELWVDAPDTVCVHPGAGPVRGTGAINRSWALVMANTSYIQFFLTDVHIGLHGSTASVTCTENVLTGDDRTGPDAFGGGSALTTNVFVLVDDRWRLWMHHASPVLSQEDT